MPFRERRCHPRFPFHSSGCLVFGDREFPGTVLDLSLHGCLFATHEEPPTLPGLCCRVTIHRGGRQPTFSAQGRLAHNGGRWLGVAFDAPDEALRIGLRRIIELNLGTLSLMDRELPALLCRPR